jgi:ABC-type branched-subunit amino acid transport system substrate-binding protein
VHKQAQAAILSSGNGSLGSGTTDTGSGSQPTLPGGSSTSSPGTGGVVTNPTTGQQSTGGTKTGGGPSTAPSSGGQGPSCGTGTDVGLTSSTVDVGTIADVTGPVSGLFQGAEQGAVTFANFINNTNNGICGRHLNVAYRDGGTSCTQTQNAAQSLVSKVFAFMGSFALYDNCAASVLKQHPTVPDIHDSLDPAATTLANHFDIEPGHLGYATGMFEYYKRKYGSKVLHVGTIAEALPSALSKQHAITNAAKSVGWKFVDEIDEQPTNSNFTQDFIKLCGREHIQIFFTVTENAQNASAMIQNENAAGCPKSLINIMPIAYDQAFVDAFSGNTGAINGLQGYNEYAMFFNKEDAAQIPELKLLQEWYARSYPGQPLNLYAMFAWASGRMLQYAMEHAGPTISRKTVLAALRKMKNFSANGMIAPETPSSKTEGVHCYVLWQFANGKFQRLDDPPISGPTGGYRCDGKFVPYNG